MLTPSDAATQGAAPISLRAYGRSRKDRGLPGGSTVAVSRAVARQRLVASIVYVDGEPKIADAQLADQEWEQNTDHSRAPGAVKAAAEGVTAPDVTDSAVTPARRAGGRQPSALVEASTREKNAKADLAELEFQEKAGRLVSAQEVEKVWAEVVTAARTAVLAVPSKYKLGVSHLTHAELAYLNELLCQALEGLAEDRPVHRGAAA